MLRARWPMGRRPRPRLSWLGDPVLHMILIAAVLAGLGARRSAGRPWRGRGEPAIEVIYRPERPRLNPGEVAPWAAPATASGAVAG